MVNKNFHTMRKNFHCRTVEPVKKRNQTRPNTNPVRINNPL